MNNRTAITLPIILSLLFSSCNVYNDQELIEEGKLLIDKYSEKLKDLYSFTEKNISADTCVYYRVNTSRTTDRFDLDSTYFKNIPNYSITNSFPIKTDESLSSEIRKRLPLDDINNFYFIKDIFIAFNLSKYRNNNRNYIRLVYIFDEERFKRIFSEYNFFKYDNRNTVDINKKWICLYEGRWAITSKPLWLSEMNTSYICQE